ncbi:hypothetical protein VTI28DRAFT_10297 [Corynascus sepedonium]
MTTTTSLSSRKKSIRPHRKSRAGCGYCKRRKVKCDEGKPCDNCKRFGLPCDLVPESVRPEHCAVPITRQGRGRPRKSWERECPTICSLATPTPPLTSSSESSNAGSAHINLDDVELLLHFVTATAETFSGMENTEMHRFWTRSAAQIGLSSPFILHFVFATAAFHLFHLVEHQDEKRSGSTGSGEIHTSTQLQLRDSATYLSLAHQHFTAGLSGFSAQLSQPGPENCGALYLGATMVSYCTFAAGPTSRNDLLVCTVSDDGLYSAPHSPPSTAAWMPFVQGVRLMRERFGPDVLFAGLMAPFKPGRPTTPLKQPACLRDGFPRLEWEAALDGLRSYIAADSAAAASTRESCLRELDKLIAIYAANYGRRSSSPDGELTYDGPPENQFVFGWLYCMQPEFVSCIRRSEPCALLVLAHYAILLNRGAVRGGWYIDGWREHIVKRIAEILAGQGDEYRKWMRWPAEQVAGRMDLH